MKENRVSESESIEKFRRMDKIQEVKLSVYEGHVFEQAYFFGEIMKKIVSVFLSRDREKQKADKHKKS